MGILCIKLIYNKSFSISRRSNADCTLSLKPMDNFDRYGVVELNENDSIKSFKEKQFYESGLINGGVYALNTEKFLRKNLPENFLLKKITWKKMWIF